MTTGEQKGSIFVDLPNVVGTAAKIVKPIENSRVSKGKRAVTKPTNVVKKLIIIIPYVKEIEYAVTDVSSSDLS